MKTGQKSEKWEADALTNYYEVFSSTKNVPFLNLQNELPLCEFLISLLGRNYISIN